MIGYGSAVVNGQLVNVAERTAYDPLVFGQAYTGQGMWYRQGVYNVPPVLPAPGLASSMSPASYGALGGYPLPTQTAENGSPFHATKSPLWWALGFLVISLLLLHFVHYRR